MNPDAEWIEETALCVVCPECAFTFDAIHTDAGVDTYSCPLCALTAAEAERDEAAEWLQKLHRPYPNVSPSHGDCAICAFLARLRDRST